MITAGDVSLPLILRMLASTAAAVALLAVCGLAVSRLPRLLRLAGACRHALRLTNQGNVRSNYELVVESPYRPLRFRLTRQGIPLARLEPPTAPVEENEPLAEAPPARASVQDKQPAKPPEKSPGVGKSAGQAWQKAGKTAKSSAGFGGAVGGLLGMLGSLIPGAAGQQLRAQGAAMRRVQTETIRAVQAPEAELRKVEEIKKRGGNLGDSLGGGLGKPGPAKPSPALAAQSERRPETAASLDGGRGKARGVQRPRRLAKPAPGYYAAQTGEVGPGESVQLELEIIWKQHRLPESSLQYSIRSQQVPLAFAGQEKLAPITRQGMVYFGGVDAWRYWLFYLGATLVVAAGLLSFAAALAWIWG